MSGKNLTARGTGAFRSVWYHLMKFNNTIMELIFFFRLKSRSIYFVFCIQSSFSCILIILSNQKWQVNQSNFLHLQIDFCYHQWKSLIMMKFVLNLHYLVHYKLLFLLRLYLATYDAEFSIILNQCNSNCSFNEYSWDVIDMNSDLTCALRSDTSFFNNNTCSFTTKNFLLISTMRIEY